MDSEPQDPEDPILGRRLDRHLTAASGYAFFNTSKFTFARLLDAPADIALNLKAWINGFSENMFEVLRKFDFDNTIGKLEEADLLYLVKTGWSESSCSDERRWASQAMVFDLPPRLSQRQAIGQLELTRELERPTEQG